MQTASFSANLATGDVTRKEVGVLHSALSLLNKKRATDAFA
jgi:hypothetical protein